MSVQPGSDVRTNRKCSEIAQCHHDDVNTHHPFSHIAFLGFRHFHLPLMSVVIYQRPGDCDLKVMREVARPLWAVLQLDSSLVEAGEHWTRVVMSILGAVRMLSGFMLSRFMLSGF